MYFISIFADVSVELFVFFLKVLQTGQEINEVDQSGFNVTSPTILAANLGNNKFIVQICPTTVRLLDVNASVVQELEVASDFVINSASACDPYVLLLSSDGRVGFLKFVEGSQLSLSFPVPSKVTVSITELI